MKGTPAGDMSLRVGVAHRPMLLDEGLHVGLLDGLLHDGEGRDHLDVGQGHVARSGRRRDLGVLEFRGEAVHVRKGQSRGLKGLEGQGGGDGLRSAARADGVLAQDIEIGRAHV